MVIEIIEICMISILAVSCPNPQYIGNGYHSVETYLAQYTGQNIEFVDNDLVMDVVVGHAPGERLKFDADYLDPLIFLARQRYSHLQGRKILFVVKDAFDFDGLASPGSNFQGAFVRTQDLTDNIFYVVVAHELLHLEGYAHTCEIPNSKSTPADIAEFKECREEYGSDIMHPYACPDEENLEDCKFEGDHRLPDPWLE